MGHSSRNLWFILCFTYNPRDRLEDLVQERLWVGCWWLWFRFAV